MRDCNLALPVYDIELMKQLFAVKAGAKGNGALALKNDPDSLSLGIEQFFTLLVHLAFARDNPRYASGKDVGFPGDKTTKDPQVPVLQCVENLMNSFLPKMHKGNQKEFQMVLKGDQEAQSVIQSFSEKIGRGSRRSRRRRRSRAPMCSSSSSRTSTRRHARRARSI